MPSTNQYDATRLVAVSPFAGSPILYGFRTNCKAATSTALGHVDVAAAAGPVPGNLVVGARSPKPGRASRKNSGEHESSFYDHSVRAALRADRWRLSDPFFRAPTATDNSVTVCVSTNSLGNATGVIRYAWQMQLALFNRIQADLPALGIDLPDAADEDLVFGANRPKLPRVSKEDGPNTLTTFCAPARFGSLPAGWSPAGGSRRYKRA